MSQNSALNFIVLIGGLIIACSIKFQDDIYYAYIIMSSAHYQ
uniref:Uncharacterized protein n=1 Tax=Rhizophora mucronata TaxID=61149 RepID=A0A2P2J125_RHIMU